MSLPVQRTPQRSDLISRRAAAKELGVHANTVDRAAKKLKLQQYRLLGDNRVFYLREDIGRIEIVVPIEEPS